MAAAAGDTSKSFHVFLHDSPYHLRRNCINPLADDVRKPFPLDESCPASLPPLQPEHCSPLMPRVP